MSNTRAVIRNRLEIVSRQIDLTELNNQLEERRKKRMKTCYPVEIDIYLDYSTWESEEEEDMEEEENARHIWLCRVYDENPYRCRLSDERSRFVIQFGTLMELISMVRKIAFPNASFTQNRPLQIVDTCKEFPVYSMTQKRRGICLIINNVDYADPSKVRSGSQKDCKDLKATFRKILFKVIVLKNLTDSNIISAIKKMSTRDHSQYDSFVCCILAHGGRGTVTGVNDKPVHLEKITSNFRVCDCPSLAGKPKVFIIQACQGSREQRGVELHQSDSISDDTPLMTLADGADFFMAYATEPGFKSYRNPRTGSFFINSLCKNINQYKSHELSQIMRKVCAEIAHITINDDMKQVPWVSSTLTKDLVLWPVYTNKTVT
ncbi:caspase-3-like [Gigantopelta aegis]|uniref:caspase-3-like n=1 Tax=Gigantopelta aegis TaxID=1735272 RepID=UPI001B88B960|nr:caspase-3-like [Gigantopelta aegis]